MVGSSSPLSFSTLKVLKLCPRPRVQLARRCGLKSSDGCFFCCVFFFSPRGFSGKKRTPPPKKTGWDTHHMNGEDKFFQLFLSVSVLGNGSENYAKSGRKKNISKKTDSTEVSLVQPPDLWSINRIDCIQSFPPSVGSNSFQSIHFKNKNKSQPGSSFPKRRC